MSKAKNTTLKPLPPNKGKTVNTSFVEAFQKVLKNKEMFFEFLDMFPYAIQVFAPDGTSIFANRALCEEHNIADAKEIVGYYNVFKDPVLMDVLGLREPITRVFQGETLSASNVRVPMEDISARYTKITKDTSDVKYQTITGFPMWDDKQQIAFVVAIFQTTQVFKGRREITRALEYMDNKWLEEFDLDKIANAANLSVYHFSRLFKQTTGVTPFARYKEIKINKLKEKLCDPNLNISQAFDVCGVEYNGNYRQIFKEITGITPSQYRKKQICSS